METSGLDPEITICKIAVLPIKLYSLYFYTNSYPKNDLNVYDLHQQSLKLSCLPFPALGLFALRPEWFEHSSKLSWAAGFTN